MAQKRGCFKIPSVRKRNIKARYVGVVVAFSLAIYIYRCYFFVYDSSKIWQTENLLILTVLLKLIYCKKGNSPKYKLYPATT